MKTRREFLRDGARWLALPLLVATVGRMAARPGDPCDRAGLCAGCRRFEGCPLPAATAVRETRKDRV